MAVLRSHCVVGSSLNELSMSLPKRLAKQANNLFQKTPECPTSSKITINDIPDLILDKILGYFSVMEKLKVERVSKHWRKTVKNQLSRLTGLATTVAIEHDWQCTRFNSDHSIVGGDIREVVQWSNGWFYDVTNSQSLHNITSVLKKCPNVRSLHLNHCILSAEALEKIERVAPRLECLVLRGVVVDKSKLGDNSWLQVGQAVGKRLIHLAVNPNYEFRMNDDDMLHVVTQCNKLRELRLGNYFDKEFQGKFVKRCTKRLQALHMIGRELSLETLDQLTKKSSNLKGLSFISYASKNDQIWRKIGEKLTSLTSLKVNLFWSESIINSQSPIIKLKHLKQLSIDLTAMTDDRVDEGFAWILKDGSDSIVELEVTRAGLKPKSLESLGFWIPQLRHLILHGVEFQCSCTNTELLDRIERFACTHCRKRGWQALANNLRCLNQLTQIQPSSRHDSIRRIQDELVDKIGQFTALRRLTLHRFDITEIKKDNKSYNLIEEIINFVESKLGHLNEDFVLELRFSVADVREDARKAGKKWPKNLKIISR